MPRHMCERECTVRILCANMCALVSAWIHFAKEMNSIDNSTLIVSNIQLSYVVGHESVTTLMSNLPLK